MTSNRPPVESASICVVSTPDMTPIWARAAQELDSSVRVVEAPPSPQMLAELVEGSSLVVLDSPLWKLIPHLHPSSSHLVLLSKNWEVELSVPLLDAAGYQLEGNQWIEAELLGSPSICHFRAYFAHLVGTKALHPALLSPTHGPGAGNDGEITLWDTSVFEGRGVKISRDDPTLLEETFRASVGQASLWAQPGFPFLAPSSPLTFQSLDGDPVQGLLCSSSDRSGSWVVLTRHDILDILGHPGDVPWSRLPDLMGVPAASALLSWLAASA